MTQRFWVHVMVLALVASGAALRASADDNASSETKVQSDPAAPAASGVDDLITNNNLRAYSGSLSRWSIASQFNYNGGTISEPLSQDRPNISASSGTTAKSDLDGSISVKFNINQKNSLMAGFGTRWIAPLTKGGPTNYNGSTVDAMNPYLQYQYIYKWLGVQSVLQVQGMQWTQSDFTALGYSKQLNIDQENIVQIGKSNLSIGASVWLQYQLFNKSGAYGDPNSDSYIPDVATQQSVFSFAVAPVLEYAITDKINFRTLVNLWMYEHYASMPKQLTLVHDTTYQSVGLGLSITRDIFLYPNIQFLPQQMEAAMTNVALAATINLF